MKEKYMECYGNRYELTSPQSGELMELFRDTCSRRGILCDNDRICRYLWEFPEENGGYQLLLWD